MPDQRDPEPRLPAAVEVRTPGRLHIGMLSFGRPDVRSFGGVGVMIDRPGMHVRLERSETFRGAGPLGERAVEFARRCVEFTASDSRDSRRIGPHAACTIEVLSAPRPHVGLGSGTQLALAVAAGVRQLFRPVWLEQSDAYDGDPVGGTAGRALRFDDADVIELARAVGRGRRSCVGLHGFGRGGLIIEAGRFVRPGVDAPADRLSPLLARVRLPTEWRCLVIVQRDAVGLHGEAEKVAFARLSPVPREVSAELARIAIMELVPAAIEGDFDGFSDAMHRYGLLAGGPFEPESSRLPYAAATARLIAWLGTHGVRGAAQSSWGPAVMACCPSADAATRVVEALDRDGLAPLHDVTVTEFNARGAVLRTIE